METNLDKPILVTGGAGFIGSRVIENLKARGFKRIRCFSRRPKPSSPGDGNQTSVEWIHGNLHSPEDCARATKDVQIILHLAAGTGTKSYADAFLNSVVTTRNLLDAAVAAGSLKRFVNISSFAVYSNQGNPERGLLDERGPEVKGELQKRDAYTYAKIKQDELVREYGKRCGISYAVIRPGAVYGPGKRSISARVGINPFGVFLHLAGWSRIPLTYVDNCAEAIVLAGITPGANGEVFNVVDDNIPSGFEFLRMRKRGVGRLRSVYMPKWFSYSICFCWEKYTEYSKGQLPPVYTRAAWFAYWKGARYSNEKMKKILGWSQVVSTTDGLKRYFDDCRKEGARA